MKSAISNSIGHLTYLYGVSDLDLNTYQEEVPLLMVDGLTIPPRFG